jgi:dihydroorotate dehydrogenase electron transfer subunit
MVKAMKEKMVQERVKITGKENLGSGYFKLSLLSPGISRLAKPGQFVEIKVTDADEPLLRRPLGVHRVKGNTFEILCEIVGKGTTALSEKKPGELLDVIGPLGNGFDCHGAMASVIVAGGMGVAPLIFLAERLMEVKSQKSKVKILVLIGAKTKTQILCENEFRKIGCEVRVATDDGSRGFKGKVTELLNKEARSQRPEVRSIYACGPEPMLMAVSKISVACNISAQVSLEAHMSCGFGACLGCVVNTIDGYKRVCKDGPVFLAEDVVWR